MTWALWPYAGGRTKAPTYEDVKTGSTGHAESVRIVFDPAKLSYAELLEKWFFRMHDPTTRNRQGNDVGTQYRSAIFVTTPEQRRIAEEVKARVDKSGKWRAPLVTEIVEAGPFTRAEEYHQKYLEKNPGAAQVVAMTTKLWIDSGQYQLALDYWEARKAKDPRNAEVLGILASINRQAGKAAFFFACFAGAIVWEITSGNYYAGMDFTARSNGGFFVKGLWGLITLGTRPRQMTLTGLTEGDNSIVLMANGLIALLTLALLAVVWIWSVRDAVRYRAHLNAGERHAPFRAALLGLVEKRLELARRQQHLQRPRRDALMRHAQHLCGGRLVQRDLTAVVARRHDVDDDEADRQGDRGHRGEVENRAQRQPARLRQVSEPGDADDDRREDGRRDDDLDEVDEQIREPLHLGRLFREQEADGRAQHDGDEHPEVQVLVDRFAACGGGRHGSSLNFSLGMRVSRATVTYKPTHGNFRQS